MMSKVLIPALLVYLISTSGHAVIVRHDRDEQAFLNLGRQYPSTVMLDRADGRNGLGDEGTLIAPSWVLTTAHVASELGPEIRLTFREKSTGLSS